MLQTNTQKRDKSADRRPVELFRTLTPGVERQNEVRNVQNTVNLLIQRSESSV